MPFGHDETWTELSEGGGNTIFLFTVAPDGTRSLARGHVEGWTIAVQFDAARVDRGFVMSALADVDGDGVRECVLSENNGGILIVRADRESRRRGLPFRLQLEGFSAARPGPVPVVYRASRIRNRSSRSGQHKHTPSLAGRPIRNDRR
jgi:hypothetical protein